ncbi:MAG: hypothetical protein JNM30_03130 [Rhodospirillales bacterium]|nr:hypothetical protein [Rhodospirillales bacterium]
MRDPDRIVPLLAGGEDAERPTTVVPKGRPEPEEVIEDQDPGATPAEKRQQNPGVPAAPPPSR